MEDDDWLKWREQLFRDDFWKTIVLLIAVGLLVWTLRSSVCLHPGVTWWLHPRCFEQAWRRAWVWPSSMQKQKPVSRCSCLWRDRQWPTATAQCWVRTSSDAGSISKNQTCTDMLKYRLRFLYSEDGQTTHAGVCIMHTHRWPLLLTSWCCHQCNPSLSEGSPSAGLSRFVSNVSFSSELNGRRWEKWNEISLRTRHSVCSVWLVGQGRYYMVSFSVARRQGGCEVPGTPPPHPPPQSFHWYGYTEMCWGKCLDWIMSLSLFQTKAPSNWR